MIGPELHQYHCDDFDPVNRPLFDGIRGPELHQYHCDDFDVEGERCPHGVGRPELHQYHCDDFDRLPFTRFMVNCLTGFPRAVASEKMQSNSCLACRTPIYLSKNNLQLASGNAYFFITSPLATKSLTKPIHIFAQFSICNFFFVDYSPICGSFQPFFTMSFFHKCVGIWQNITFYFFFSSSVLHTGSNLIPLDSTHCCKTVFILNHGNSPANFNPLEVFNTNISQ